MPPHFDGWHQDTNLPTVSLPSISAFSPQSFWSGNTVCQWCLLNKQFPWVSRQMVSHVKNQSFCMVSFGLGGTKMSSRNVINLNVMQSKR
jgi:hypothetical protein